MAIDKKKRVLILGYPKSGTTWLTRLTAEILNSPIKGFLYSDHSDLIIDGKDRNGDYEILKGHQQLSELQESEFNVSKILYIYRDPRDVAISASHYFYNRELWEPLSKIAHRRKPKYVLKKLVGGKLGPFLIRNRVIRAILHGDKKLDYWCRVSWAQHVEPYIDNDQVLSFRYEDLLNDTEFMATKIANFIDDDIQTEQIKKSIDNQSFSKLKKKFKNNTIQTKFLRSGNKEQWKEILTKRQKREFKQHLFNQLERLKFN